MRDVPEHVPTRDEVLVDVRAISLNRGEWRALGAVADGFRPGWDFPGSPAEIQDGPPAGARVVGILPGQVWAERVAVPQTLAGRTAR